MTLVKQKLNRYHRVAAKGRVSGAEGLASGSCQRLRFYYDALSEASSSVVRAKVGCLVFIFNVFERLLHEDNALLCPWGPSPIL